MILSFTAQAWSDYQFWVASDPATLRRINDLIRDASRNPFSGIGKPEPLKLNWEAGGRAGSRASIVWFIA